MDINDFNEAVKHFKQIDSHEAFELIEAKEGNLIFVGRETCPYCRLFVSKLAEAAITSDLNVYFLHSQTQNDLEGTQMFREKYNVVTVPGLVYADSNRTETVCDSSMKVEEIIDFARAY
ncbi:thiol reductase thioredoxin [Facklamia sp. P12945]|uniref:thiol reductase thioredoxin n=1 Tax=unclassified Facklamia TaxID=2622293 RepID=UPI003D17FB6A